MAVNELSVSTDFNGSDGDPRPGLRAIAEAGFTHVHWAHQCNGDFMFSQCEIRAFSAMLKEFGLKVLDAHGPSGKDKNWYSTCEWQRQAGVELVKNHIDAVAELGGDALAMHRCCRQILDPEQRQPAWDAQRRSIDELSEHCRVRGVTLAIENWYNENFQDIYELMADYPPDILSFCYDAGHGFLFDNKGLELAEPIKDRLTVVHLHDVDSSHDLHMIPFHGAINWDDVCKMIASSAYAKPLTLEVLMSMGACYYSSGIYDFMEMAKAAGDNLAQKVEDYR